MTTTATATATATEALTETRNAFNRLRAATKARDAMPVDWTRFAELMGERPDEEADEALVERAAAAFIGAATVPMDREGALAAVEAVREKEYASEWIEDIPDAGMAALLRELVDAEDLDGGVFALALVPFSPRIYANNMRAMVDAADPSELRDADRLRTVTVQAIQESTLREEALSEELAGAVLDAIRACNALHAETPHQRAIRKAFKEARALMDLYGDDDMRTLSAVYEAMELQEPGCTMRMMRQCGINLEPTHCGPNGEPLYSLDAVAASLDADPEELVEKVHELEGMGFVMRAGEAEANRLH